MELTDYERHLVVVSLELYVSEIRKACEEDQGNPDGEPGTTGCHMQQELKQLQRKFLR